MLCTDFKEKLHIMLCGDFRGIFQENNLHSHEILRTNKETSDSISSEIIISNVSITQPYSSTKDDATTLNIYCLKIFSNSHTTSSNSSVYMCVCVCVCHSQCC